MYRIEEEFDYNDYHCVVTFNEIGYYEGYIALHKDDVFYNKSWYYINDKRALSIKIASAGRTTPKNDGNFWLGFICDEQGTKPDTDRVKEIWGDKAMVLTFLNMQKLSPIPKTGKIRDIEYVKDKLKKLVNEVRDENRRQTSRT